jgi:hypothetical protein
MNKIIIMRVVLRTTVRETDFFGVVTGKTELTDSTHDGEDWISI